MRDAGVLLEVRLGLGLQDAEPQLVVGRMQVDDQPPLQPRLDPLLEPVDLARRPVGGDDDLLLLLDQRVEGVEELLLRRVLAGDELHVVDHQHVDRAEHLLEAVHLLEAQRRDEAVHELLGREVEHPRLGVAAAHLPGDGVHQVGLAEADAAVEEQRVEAHRPALGHALGDPARGGVRQLVRLADDEIVEGAAPVERRRRAGRTSAPRATGRTPARPAPRRDRGSSAPAGGTTPNSRRLTATPSLQSSCADRVAVVAQHPGADEARRRREMHDAVVRADVDQRVDPVLEGVVAELAAQARRGRASRPRSGVHVVRRRLGFHLGSSSEVRIRDRRD